VDTVLVLNADLGPLHRVSLRHAIRMLCRQVVEIHESEDHIPRFGVWPKPTIVRLISYIVPKWRYTDGPAWSRPGVLARDSRKCGYCGGHATTVDHITPRSQGGRNDWLNTVASCDSCNQHKGNKTPTEAGMRLLIKPAKPTWKSLAAHR
jgi:5-methylcytosine-specific restriction endonuclease McrA